MRTAGSREPSVSCPVSCSVLPLSGLILTGLLLPIACRLGSLDQTSRGNWPDRAGGGRLDKGALERPRGYFSHGREDRNVEDDGRCRKRNPAQHREVWFRQ